MICARLAFLAVLLGLMPLAGVAAETSSSDIGVRIKDLSFTPKVVHIHVGSVVTWTNDDDMAHTVTSGVEQDDGTWTSATLSYGKSFAMKFTKAGTFPYYCKFHSYDDSMHGVVIVAQ